MRQSSHLSSDFSAMTPKFATRNETPFTILSLGTKRRWKTRDTGEYESQTTWHRCIVWGRRSEFAATLTKGTHVQIEGEIRTARTQRMATSGPSPACAW